MIYYAEYCGVILQRLCLCKSVEESPGHILQDCSVAQQYWNWLAWIFNSWHVADLKACYKTMTNKSALAKDLWLLAI